MEKEEAIVEVKKNIHLIKAPHAGMSRQIVKLYSKSYDPVQGIWIHDIDFSTHEVLVYLTIADITDTYAHCTVPLTGCCNWNDSVWIIWNKKTQPSEIVSLYFAGKAKKLEDKMVQKLQEDVDMGDEDV